MKITNFELRMTNHIHKTLTIKHLQIANSLKILFLEKIYIFLRKSLGVWYDSCTFAIRIRGSI